jgi:hypothetical protein
MLMSWLEPTLKDRIDQAVNNCCEDQRVKDLYDEYMRVLQANRPQLVFELENLFNASFRLGADLAYRIGFREGLELGTDIHKKICSQFAPNRAITQK